MINYGLVGVGGFGQTWLRSLAALEQQGVARVAAAAERDRAGHAPEVAALEARGCRVYGSLGEMLRGGSGAIDIIGIATGIATHVPLAIEALEAGYPVLCEKPLAATVQEVARLQAAERRAGRWCAVDFQYTHSPTTAWMHARLAEGRLGAMREARCVVGWPRPASYYARNAWAGRMAHNGYWVLDGPATNAMAHHLTNMLYLAAAQSQGPPVIATVRAELYRAKPIECYDSSCIELVLRDGVRLRHLASHSIERQLEARMVIVCERGRIVWDGAADSAIAEHQDGTTERFVTPDPSRNHARSLAQVARAVAGIDPRPLCGSAEAAPQVLAINLAFESSGGVAPIAEDYVYRVPAGQSSELVCVHGMDAILTEAYERGAVFSELGPRRPLWAQASARVAADGYDAFPRHAALRQVLEASLRGAG